MLDTIVLSALLLTTHSHDIYAAPSTPICPTFMRLIIDDAEGRPVPYRRNAVELGRISTMTRADSPRSTFISTESPTSPDSDPFEAPIPAYEDPPCYTPSLDRAPSYSHLTSRQVARGRALRRYDVRPDDDTNTHERRTSIDSTSTSSSLKSLRVRTQGLHLHNAA